MNHFLSRNLLESLSSISITLSVADIEKICNAFHTVEDFSNADDHALSVLKTNAPTSLLNVVQNQLRSQMVE